MRKQKQKQAHDLAAPVLKRSGLISNRPTNKNKHYIRGILAVLAIGVLFQVASYVDPDGNFSQSLQATVTNLSTPEDESKFPPAQRYRYEIINNPSAPIQLSSAEEKEIEITIKNTGKLSWYLDENHPKSLSLGSHSASASVSASATSGKSFFHSPDSKTWLNEEKISIKSTDKKTQIKPDEKLSFNFKIRAPDTPGAYSETFMPLVGDTKWINNNRLNINVVVEGDMKESYSYEPIEKNPSENISAKTTKPITLKVKNTGKVPWYNSGQFPIQLIANSAASTSGMEEPITNPGQTANFTLNLKAPATTANFQLRADLSIKDVYTFENPLFWEINVNQKQVAITIDDGYGDIDAFIDLLNSEGVRATFFMLGCVAQQNPDAMRRIVNEGHLLASHSYCHPDFRTLSADQIRWQLSETRKIMQEITGYDVFPYFRYPYGAMNEKTHAVLKEEGWKYFHWTQSTGYYKHHGNTSEGRKQIFYYSTLNPPEQSIVLMHIISKSSLAILPEIIKWYRDHGYVFVTVDEL